MPSNNAYGPQIVTEGLVCCLDANNPKSYPGAGTTWYDLSGHGSNGVNTGVTFGNGSAITATDSIASYFIYDGTSDYTIISDSHAEFMADDTNFTFELWGCKDQDNANTDPMFMHYRPAGTYPYLHMLCYGTNGNYTDYGWICGYDDDQDGDDASGGTLFSDRNNAIDPNGWGHHLATYSGGAGQHIGHVYFNGEHLSYANATTANVWKKPVSAMNGGMTIGSSSHSVGNTTHGFEGKIGIIRVYKRALTHAEIKQNFNANRSRFGL